MNGDEPTFVIESWMTWTDAQGKRWHIAEMEPRHAWHSARFMERHVRGFINRAYQEVTAYVAYNVEHDRAPMATDAADEIADHLLELLYTKGRAEQMEWLVEDTTYRALCERAKDFTPPPRLDPIARLAHMAAANPF